MAGFEFDDGTPDSVDEGDAGAARMSANRNIYTTIRDAAGNERGVNVNSDFEIGVRLSSIDNAVLDTIDSVLDLINAKLVTGTTIGVVELSSIDNAVLDTIDAVLDLINAKLVTGTVIGAVEIVDPSFAVADGNTLGEGILIQGDDGTDRKNINVDSSTGDVQVDVTEVVPGTGAADLGKAIQTAQGSTDTGVGALVVRNDVLADLSGADGDWTPLQVSALGALFTTLAPETSGGLSFFNSIDLDETEEAVKGSAGQVYTIMAFNLTAAPQYLHFYNKTTGNVTVGTTTADLIIPIPGNADSDGAGFIWESAHGFDFNLAITVACTTDFPDDGSPAGPAANECVVVIGYK